MGKFQQSFVSVYGEEGDKRRGKAATKDDPLCPSPPLPFI
jgi:hypothetical protein